jgi:hypothetical protein
MDFLNSNNSLIFSAAAPAVAGVIATYMAYDTPPWKEEGQGEPEGIERVKAIRKYITGTDSSSPRGDDAINMIWNGADEDAHKVAKPDFCDNPAKLRSRQDQDRCSAAEPPPPEGPQCKNIFDNRTRYVTRDTLVQVLKDDFCPGWDNVIGGTLFNKLVDTGSPEETWLTIEQLDDQAELVKREECQKNMETLLDACDGDSITNPMNWKAGGSQVFRGWNYTIAPNRDRPEFPTVPKAWCKLELSNDSELEALIWGAGWLNNGHGWELRQAFANLEGEFQFRTEDGAWKFGYELLDGHEWYAFVPGPKLKFFKPDDLVGTVENLIKGVVNVDGFDVACEL